MMPMFPREIPRDQIAKYERSFLLRLYEEMFRIREFEERVRFLFLEGAMPGTIHQCQGQEATAVGVCQALNEDDYLTSTHRPHGHALAKGLTPLEILLELFGSIEGCCKGKGGSMHIGNMAKGMPPAIAIVGGNIPVAAGMALALKMQKRPQIVACFFGDGATSEGAFHEAVNMAAIWNLPVVFCCENNLYGASTHVSKITRLPSLRQRATAYGIEALTVDGNNVLAVYEMARTAAVKCRAGEGPVFLELITYRLTGHSRRDPCLYMPKEERAAWAAMDPLLRLREALLDRGEVTVSELEAVELAVKQAIEQAVEIARKAPPPTLDDLETDVYAKSEVGI